VTIGNIVAAQYCIGVSSGGAQIVPWTAMSAATGTVTIGDLLLSNGTTYYVSVRAVSDSGFMSPVGSGPGQMVDAAVPPAPPAPSVQIGQYSIVLDWAQVIPGASGVMGYIIEYSMPDSPTWRNLKNDKVTFDTVAAIHTQAVSASDVVEPPYSTNTMPQGTILLRTRAVSGAGLLGPPSPVVQIQNGGLPPSGMSRVSAFPNPFDSRKGSVTIAFTLATASSVNIDIYSIYGAKVVSWSVSATAGTNVTTWDGTADSGHKVSKGLYLAVITAGGAKTTLKIGVLH
jgi:hypothetical protein